MKTHLIDPKEAITAYQAIIKNGVKTEAGTLWQGITASSDFDGYTVFLSDTQVELTIYYHYKYNLQYSTQEALDNFDKKIQAILSSSA